MAVFPISRPVFRPAMEVITAITTTQAQDILTYTITTGQNHYYRIGLVVRFTIPQGAGMEMLNGTLSPYVTFTINTIPALNQFTVTQIDDNGNKNDPFVAPPSSAASLALVIPVAETDFQLYQSVHNVLPNGGF